MSDSQPPDVSHQRMFAVDVVNRLRTAGFEALWAGGCVRDELLGITPKDFDVATTATPQQVIELFGKRKTVPVGVSFGVVMVLGPNRQAGQIEVATFRSDGEYLDGRRPSEIQFCSAEEDAKRRDFTINGMFFDPITDTVIDYVGGREDLQKQTVQAIGNAVARFSEDKLRMLRAVRFAATYRFQLDSETAEAIRKLAGELHQVSIERIAQELRRMLAHETRDVSLANLKSVNLLPQLFPELDCDSQAFASEFDRLVETTARLKENHFEPTFALLLCLDSAVGLSSPANTQAIKTECRRFRMSNEESLCISWLITSAVACVDADSQPLHIVKPIIADERFFLLLDLLQATDGRQQDAEFLNQYKQHTPNHIASPPPLINGSVLQQLGIKPGPEFKRILTTVRNEQLDEELHTPEDAVARANSLIAET